MSAGGVAVDVFVTVAFDALLFVASNDDFKCGYTTKKK
jgi:hypothetical protein